MCLRIEKKCDGAGHGAGNVTQVVDLGSATLAGEFMKVEVKPISLSSPRAANDIGWIFGGLFDQEGNLSLVCSCSFSDCALYLQGHQGLL